MIKKLNNYQHGYVALPVIKACKEHGLFEVLNFETPLVFAELVKKMQANSGYLRAALHMLESLNWISRNDHDEYLLARESADLQKIPEDIVNLLSFPMKEYLIANPRNKKQKKPSLQKWIEISGRRWDIENAKIADFLDGILVFPLLLALKENNLLNNLNYHQTTWHSKLNPSVRQEIMTFFTNQGWLSEENGVIILTAKGRFISERILITANITSYNPILVNISEMIFGDCQSVFHLNQSEHEQHINYILNPPGNDFHHERYLDDLEVILLSIFNRHPFEEQPKYIADTGCGDATLLKTIFEIVKNKTLRGKVLDIHPLKLVGMDFNEKAIQEAARTLKDLDHLVLKCDIEDPQRIMADLKKHGIGDFENILHARFFFDHNRPYTPPLDKSAVETRLNIPSEAVYIDCEGNTLPAASVIQSYVEHFEQWSKVLGRFGLIILEAHCLEPKIVSQNIEDCESFSFDALHRFSQQLLVEADKFLVSAAEAGLFPIHDHFNKYPKTSPFTRITLNYFERREYRIRHAQTNDLPDLEQLEMLCWEPGLRTSVSTLKRRLQQYPDGQFVLEIGRNVVGVIYSQRVTKVEDVKTVSFENIDELHQNEGCIVQLLAVNILPSMQHRNLGDQLLEFMLQRCTLMNGIHRVIGVTRCKNYHQYANSHKNTTLQEYIGLRNKYGKLADSILRFHELHGAQVKELIPQFRPQDGNNKGYGILVEYDILYRQRNDIQMVDKHMDSTVKAETIPKVRPIKDFIVNTITVILGKTKEYNFSLEHPLMELGLNSADLLELNEQIRYEYQIILNPDFFFVYNTPEKIITYIQEQADSERSRKEAGKVIIEPKTIPPQKQAAQDNHQNLKPNPEFKDFPTQRKEVAIIGVACRLPGGIANKDQLWNLLINSKDVMGKMPSHRFCWPSGIDTENQHHGIDYGGFLDEIAYFDAAFFRISPKEAELMDPQQRIMLEVSWECLEDAGYSAKAVSGSKTGVFIGASGSDYNKLLEQHLEAIEAHYGVGTSMAVLSNRISYFYDFQGPSIQIDTACSSSLVAIHEAVKAIQTGDCDQALVGGINIICHPANNIIYFKAGMLSKDGKCKTFDKEANGYARGEGAAVIFLKPLEQAYRDQDSILAVIKGTAINHGGQAGGLTVPNPDKQATLLVEAYQSAGFSPETISYIEAHGTGTALGDPIEISGLKEAFARLSRTKEATRASYCGLGSIKTNIGHLEAAAGLAGLLKVILSMRYQTLPPSLNFHELNPYISLENSPFYIVDKIQPWRPDGQHPRRAGISSFGSGGANAHVALEEAPVITSLRNRRYPANIICLSAKTEEALRQKERDLVLWLEKEDRGLDLAAISATLLLGREHFNKRVAFVVGDLAELRQKLREVMDKGQADGYFKECGPDHKKQRQPLFEELGRKVLMEIQEAGEVSDTQFINRLTALAELYTNGYELDWKLMYGEEKIPRPNLPTYPFAREYHWIHASESEAAGSILTNSKPIPIHSLLRQNTSNLYELKFSSTFTGREFYLADHVIQGQRVLPGVVYLEMARAAVQLARMVTEQVSTGIRLENVVWVRPMVVKELPVPAYITLFPEKCGKIVFEICSESQKKEESRVIHCQGQAALFSFVEMPTLDLPSLQIRCTQKILSSHQCYQTLKSLGIEYGPGLRSIETLYLGQDEMLARLSIPTSLSSTLEQLVLHPSLMDAALQGAVAFLTQFGAMDVLLLPFALRQIEIFGPVTATMWALIHYDKEGIQNKTRLAIDLTDDAGTVQVRMKGFLARKPKSEMGSEEMLETNGTLMFEPCWKEETQPLEGNTPVYARQLALFCDPGSISREEMITQMHSTHCLFLQSEKENMAEQFQTFAIQVFHEIRSILLEKIQGPVLVQIVVFTRDNGSLYIGLSGLLKTAQLENPNLIGQLIELEPGNDVATIVAKLRENSRSPADQLVRYRGGKRWVTVWNELEISPEDMTIPWQERGVYLITGGVGGLGLIFANEIARRFKEATLILVGRSALDAEKESRIKELEALGIRTIYRQVNVSEPQAAAGLIKSLIQEYGNINGIIHSAGVTRDSFIIKKTEAEFLEVLAPKVTGLAYLDQACQDLPLDFFILFSSIVGALGNVGQADYATANAFMNSYAEYRNTLVASGRRQGRTLVINWPLWEEGGMKVSEMYQKVFRQNLGITPMRTTTGIMALYRGLATGKNQVMVMEGDVARIRQALVKSWKDDYHKVFTKELSTAPSKTPAIMSKNIALPVRKENLGREKALNYFKKMFSSATKLPVNHIKADTALEEYGIDSFIAVELTHQLERVFGTLPKTLLFEYQNIRGLTDYFLETHSEILTDILGLDANTAIAAAGTPTARKEPAAPVLSGYHPPLFPSILFESSEDKAFSDLDIAIIGLAGRYPKAGNIYEFWQNLRDGKDCISEIPEERWDYRLYFNEDKNNPGTTYSKWGGFLDGMDRFDPLFFNISPREAELMDPQERLFLECVFETLEDAGYTREALTSQQDYGLESNVGVFVGVMYEEYQLYAAQKTLQGSPMAFWGIPGSIANRVSYFCNFNGPSMAVDTMCSSSLTAIHLASQSIQRGECALAIAGGVNVTVHPNKFLFLAQGKFISSKGRCESFGQGGDGYVPGEGVGAVLLKPLTNAVADKDHIYGIIKGTAINHGGKTNGYTVPNPATQAEVIGRALKVAGINPRMISYVEAHGTGTSLGDPIEIAGLTKAFHAYTKDKQFCAIGSAKSNIGHCESAAGIAGVTKVLMQMKYGQLAPSLHANILNPAIDFDRSPFIVQRTLAQWRRPVLEMDGVMREYPRIAGVSSFGAGGSNAHVVIEEYMTAEPVQSSIPVATQCPALIVMSAKNSDRLKERVKQLLTFIREQQFSDLNLADIAYTLQVGREAMDERLGMFVISMAELLQKLENFAEDRDKGDIWHIGQVKRYKELLADFTTDDELQETVERWIRRGKYEKLLDFWVKGLDVDWNMLYSEMKPCRISLPTYPFAGEHFFVSKIENRVDNRSTMQVAAPINSLLHQNTSDFMVQRYSSTFTGYEFFLNDHIIKGQRVLPGVAYLEMARGAIAAATGMAGLDAVLAEDSKECRTGQRLKNMVWVRPVIVGTKPVRVHIRLIPNDNDKIDYEVYSSPHEYYPEEGNSCTTVNEEMVIHCQGSAVPCLISEIPTLDLKEIQAQCSLKSISSAEVYETFKMSGIDYGPGHRGIDTVYMGSGQILAKLSLPASVSNTQDQFILHPSMMDSALQASIYLSMDNDGFTPVNGKTILKPALPFTLDEIEIFSKCVPVMWALIQYSGDRSEGQATQEIYHNTRGSRPTKLDIILCDGQGKVCLRMKGYSSRNIEGEIGPAGLFGTYGTLMLEPVLEEQTAFSKHPGEMANAPAYTEHLVILCESWENILLNELRMEIETRMTGVRCLLLSSLRKGTAERFEDYAVQAFEVIQDLLRTQSRSEEKALVQIVTGIEKDGHFFSGLLGLLKTARLENPKFVGQMIEIGPVQDSAEIVARLMEESCYPSINRIRYKDGKRYIARWKELPFSTEIVTDVRIPWQDRGIYLITGGAGGLGLIFAREIAAKNRETSLVLTGRSPLSAEKLLTLQELETSGARVRYQQVDVNDQEAVAALIRNIREEFGGLNGVIHSAGVIHDNLITKKTKEEFLDVVAPKVSGLVNLDLATKDVALDFLLIFSSVAGTMGNAGQADYAFANAFMDAYAEYRNSLALSNLRHGQTLSINWPLWKEGGMNVSEAIKKLMVQTTGMFPMETKTGIQALYRALSFGKSQVMVMVGEPRRMRQKLLSMITSAETGPLNSISRPKITTKLDTGDLLKKAQAVLRQTASKLLKVKLEDIDNQIELSDYGFDSITFTELANQLNEKYNLELTPAIFFEYPTLDNFAEYLIKEHPLAFVPQQDPAHLQTRTPVVEEAETENIHSRKLPFRHGRTALLPVITPGSTAPESIAIVGMSGIFPMARDLDEFWQNLLDGRDCITEIPKDRWDWREYYGDPAKEANKTNIKWGGFIDGIAEFDPLFFGISPKEAELMDPQQRLLMTYAWKAIEDAGVSSVSLSGTKTGIFVGTMNSGYNGLLSQANVAIEGYSSTGMVSSVGPNRMSYFLNIHGPSEPIETACSSSLVAIHRAVNAITSGNCDMAIAGGVNTIINPELHISFNKAGMLCEDGRCKTFSVKADGYARGEGVGILFLKRLKDAEKARDHIYGVIRATAENHGGRANSLTAPNPKAQAELLVTAYTKAGIDPRTVSYIEAHGTGTELGDPVEINGLKSAFKELYRASGDLDVTSVHCGLGSVKTNIGHLELAAGIAGIIKVLLQLKNKTLVKSLHCEMINPYIQLQNSPFYIVQDTMEWKALQDHQGRVLPRRAGVSSFGFGGVNAHIVIEEYIPGEPVRDANLPQNPVIIVLSAKNEERLKEQVRQLSAMLRERQFTNHDLADIAFTLQVGRDPMEERLALIVSSAKELEEKLTGFLEARDDIEDLYRGQVKNNKDILAVLTANEELEEVINKWIQHRKYSQLLDLWVKGLNFDWNKLYGDVKPRRISLPTYPFAKERYWFQETNWASKRNCVSEHYRASRFKNKPDSAIAPLHPLLHQNTSDLFEQRFSSIFTGQEFFLADHVVKGQRILSGAACLEMAHAAVNLSLRAFSIKGGFSLRSLGLDDGASGVLEADTPEASKSEIWRAYTIKDVIWSRPIEVKDQAVQVHVGIFPEESFFCEGAGEISYKIYSESATQGAKPMIHCQGSMVQHTSTEIPALDLNFLQTQCVKATLSSAQCYETLRMIGFEYGPSHQGIERIYVGDNQVLAKLSLPVTVSDTEDQFILHPSLLDSALQSSIWLLNDSGDIKLSLPFYLQEIEIIDKCTSTMWSLVRYSNGEQVSAARPYIKKVKDWLPKLDIDLCDAQGKVCIRLKGLSLRTLEGEAVSLESSLRNFGTLMLHPYWKEQTIPQDITETAYDQHLVILCEPDEPHAHGLAKEIENSLKGVRCLTLQSQRSDIAERFCTYTARVFEEIQRILKAKPNGFILIQIIVSMQEEQQLFSGLAGFLKTAGLENPKLFGQLILIDPSEYSSYSVEHEIIKKLTENSRYPKETLIRYQDGKRWVNGWSEINVSAAEANFPWKDRGVYLITGGAGGLGFVFASEIVRNVKEATLILIGRSPLNGEKMLKHISKLKALEINGARIEYRQVDVTQKKALDKLVRSIRKDFGVLHGIIHCAGIIQDNFILKKTSEELHEVLAPKVSGLVNLDQASKDLNLDFFILFSSVAGAMGNPGQADYSTANAFMDGYARHRNALVAAKQRHGLTLAINWPLWKEGGMYIDAETEKMMQNKGMVAIETSTGIRALFQALATGQDQIMVISGDIELLKRFIGLDSISQEIKRPKEKASESDGSLREQTLNFVKQALANTINLPPERIQSETPFEKYGVNSIVQMNLIRELEKVTGELVKTLLFENTNMIELVDYLVKNHSDKLLDSFISRSNGSYGLQEQENSTPPGFPDFPGRVPSTVHNKHRFARLLPDSTPQNRPPLTYETSDIAIIGISGRYPLSNSLEELWEHLKAGDNCITETPDNRWRSSLVQALSGDNYPHQNHYGGFLDQIDRFDHHLFEIAPDQVWELSPELRLFLESVWETFEDAGYTKLSLQELQTRYQRGVGVFVGTMYNQYFLSIPSLEQAVLSTNGTDWQIANRTSHFFNLTGPSITVNSACSSSLTAIHLACESLKQRSCSMAIAGGVNLTLDPSKYHALKNAKFLGNGNQSKSFGTGDGYIPGEGVGAVLLKPLKLALQDQDRIYAVIKSSFANHSGGRQAYTAPDPKQQTQLILDSIQYSGISPVTIGYVESAANGSELGDPIEVIALDNAFKQYTNNKNYCALGSVKSNIGHLEAASGISQLSKVILQLKHKTLVPTINASPRNPNIKLDDTAFYLQEETKPWEQIQDPQSGRMLPRRSMINSFGAGGAYTNLIIEEYLEDIPIKGPDTLTPKEFIFIFSSKTEWSLIQYLEKMQVFLRKNLSLDECDIAETLQKINHALECRAAIVASSNQELLVKLERLQNERHSLEELNIYTSLNQDFKMKSLNTLSIQQAIDEKNWNQIAKYWIDGVTVDFNKLNGNLKTRRIELPKYEFDHNIEFSYKQNDPTLNDTFCQALSEKLSKGELSLEQFKFLMMVEK